MLWLPVIGIGSLPLLLAKLEESLASASADCLYASIMGFGLDASACSTLIASLTSFSAAFIAFSDAFALAAALFASSLAAFLDSASSAAFAFASASRFVFN